MNRVFKPLAFVFLCLFLGLVSKDKTVKAANVVVEVHADNTGMGFQDKISVNSTYRYNTEAGYIIIYRDASKKQEIFNEFDADSSYGKINLNRCIKNLGGALLADRQEINRVVLSMYQNDPEFSFEVDSGNLTLLYYDACVGIKVYKNCREKYITWNDTEFSFGPYRSPEELMENLPLENGGERPWKTTVAFWSNSSSGVIEIKKAIEEAINEEPEEERTIDDDLSYSRDSMVVYYPGKCVFCGTKAGGQLYTESGELQTIKSDIELNIGREGHYFVEWNTSPDFDGISYLPGEEICFPTKGCVLKLYGKWKPEEVEITFFSNKKSQKKRILYDGSYGAFPDLSEQGFVLQGYYSDKKKTFISENSLYKLVLDDTIEARFEAKKFPIGLDFDLPKDSHCNAALLYDVHYGTEKDFLYINYGQNIFDALPDEGGIKADGYEFDGWFFEDGSKALNGQIWDKEESLKLRGKWKNKEYTVTLHDDGKLTQICVSYNKPIKGLYPGNKEGYRFLGWSFSRFGNPEIEENDVWTIPFNADLYAQYEPVTKYVFFDYCTDWKRASKEDTLLLNFYKVVEYEDTYGYLPKPKRYGYDFLGWSREYTFDEEWNAYVGTAESIVDIYDIVTSFENETLYAVWKPKEVEVIFDFEYDQYEKIYLHQ